MKNRVQVIILLSGITIVNPLFSSGQNAAMTKEKMMEMHHETLGDSYLPNPHNNKKTSPSYKYRSSEAAKPTGATSVFTIQVNVDAGGQNILDDAGNEPSIAVDPANPDKIVIGWRQFDNVASNFRQAGWSYSSDAGQHWNFPGCD